MFVKVKEVLLERNSTTALKAAKLDTWQVRPMPHNAPPWAPGITAFLN